MLHILEKISDVNTGHGVASEAPPKEEPDSVWQEKKPFRKDGWNWKSNEYEKVPNPKKNKENKQKEE